LVYHFANGSSLNINDSTGNANNLTNGSGTAATGLLDGGVTTAGLAPAATFGPITNFTWSAWGKTTDNSNYQVLVSRDPGAHETTMRLEIGTDHATLIYNYVTNPSQPTGSANLADGNWHFWEQAFDGTDATLRIDSSVIGTIASATSTTLNYVYLGVYDQSGAFPWGGTIDEFRVSQSFRSLDWGIAEYNNQKPSSTFLTFGALTPVGGASTDTTWFQRRGFPLMHYRPTWIQVP
jgi:hypothetical protein